MECMPCLLEYLSEYMFEYIFECIVSISNTTVGCPVKPEIGLLDRVELDRVVLDRNVSD